ncbi:hypothetical protein BX266_7306 [Streptomyces sp. TLI_171]|nr:hypothetical protein BX266_7306 [Streptomyces sp. TLI_171]
MKTAPDLTPARYTPNPKPLTSRNGEVRLEY